MWNELAIAGNKPTMERNDRIPSISFGLSTDGYQFQLSFVMPIVGKINTDLFYLQERTEQTGPSLRVTGDPYAAFLEEQRKREVEWASNRASKKAKVAEQSSSKDLEAQHVKAMEEQLNAKTVECAALQSQIQDLQRSNIFAVEAHNKAQENFCKVSTIINVNPT